MNNIFKVIWNHATQTWTAVGELASAKGKSKSVKLAAISTALLAVAGGAQAAAVVQKAEGNGSLSISTANNPTDPVRAYAYANNGIAIGNGAKSGKEDARGDYHIAIGFNADASNTSSSSSTAIGANSKATGQGSTTIGNASSATGMNSTALGNSSVADSAGAVAVGATSSAWFHGSALGEEAKARGIRSTALGNRAQATSDSSISIVFKTNEGSQFAIGIGRETSVTGTESVAVGNKSTISSANVSTLGANITVGKGRDGGVVLGHSSDAAISTTKVEAVNNATVGGLTYSGFAGKLDAPTTELQGHFVSIGKQGDERQIKHVAAGKIDSASTDAINGSQLYSVADTITTAIKNVLGEPTADGKIGGVTLSGEKGANSTFSSPVNATPLTEDYKAPTDTPKTVAGALQDLNNYVNAGWKVGDNKGDKVSRITPNGQVNFVNGNGTTATVTVTPNGANGANVTFNVKKDAVTNNVLNVSEDGVSVLSGNITVASKDTKGEVKADAAKDNQVATVKNVVEAINSAGFVVSNGKSDKSELINAGKTLTLQSGDGVNVTQDGSNFTFSIDSSKIFNGKTGDITVNETTGKVEEPSDSSKLATIGNVVKAVNNAKWFAKVENTNDVITDRIQNDTTANNAEPISAGDKLTLKADKNLAVKRDGANVTYGLAQNINVNTVSAENSVTIGAGDKAITISSNDKGFNIANKNGDAMNIDNVKDGELSSISKQAVNGSQLHATNVQVSKNSQNINRVESKVDSLSRVINNHASEFNRLDRKINKQGKEARAGIAGANAAAALPQAYTAGKAMVAAAAGTFKGQNALAVGYSRISDNGKVILKLQGNANTSGDVGAGVGVGYQW